MAIVTMKRFSLLALKADKETIFDAVIRSGLVQLKRTDDVQPTVEPCDSQAYEKLAEKIAALENAVSYVSSQATKFNLAAKKAKSQTMQIPKPSFARPLEEITYDDFLSFGKNAQSIDEELALLAELQDKLASLQSKRDQIVAEHKSTLLYEGLPHSTDWYKNTETTLVRLCVVPASDLKSVEQIAADYDACVERICGTPSQSVCVAVVHKQKAEFFEKASAFGFVKSSFTCDVVPKLKLEALLGEKQSLNKQIESVQSQIAELAPKITVWKVYADYLTLCQRKIAAGMDMFKTDSTFIMEGYYPAEDEQNVSDAFKSVADRSIVYYYNIGEDEFAPTLLKNNKLVQPFESVTNMYTPSSYHEIDPNPVMSIFYFIIFGLMVADMGYGLLLCLVGLGATLLIKQKTGVRTMLQLFGICGVSAIIVGALFGSFFCYTLFTPIIPDPGTTPMVMLIISLVIGIIHICAGIGCNIAVKMKQGNKVAPWLMDFPWIVVLLSLVVAIFNLMLNEMNYPPYEVLRLPESVTNVALYVCLGSLAVAIIFAGLGTKGFLGKIKSSFGAAYGIINYFSDVMSYIRVFGLMLSSALMGQVINRLGAMVAGGGGVGYVFAGVVLVFAHVFNLVLGIMGVYIHNGRLQYIEFFGKFYTGDGVLFTPFGSQNKYVLLTDKVSQTK